MTDHERVSCPHPLVIHIQRPELFLPSLNLMTLDTIMTEPYGSIGCGGRKICLQRFELMIGGIGQTVALEST